MASAANLPPGGSAIVAPGTPAESWLLNSATLTVQPGGQTLQITANPGSQVTLDGATVNGGNARALALSSSQATIRDSTLTSTGNIGLSLTGGLAANSPGSSAVVQNSTITGIGRGLNVSGGSSATLVGSTVTGTGTGTGGVAGDGLGISLVGGEAILQDSTATGSNRGAGLFANSVGGNTQPHLVLDHSSLASQTGSAIVVSNLNAPAMLARIEIRNGSTLSAANGTLVEIGLPDDGPGTLTQASVSIDASSLQGDVRASNGAIADVALTNGAALTGNMIDVTSLSLDASRMTGDVRSSSAGTAIRLTNQANLTGSVNTAQSTLVASGSRFDMVNDSHVGALTLDGGTVSLRGGNGAFRTLTATQLAGAGTFVLGTDLAQVAGDLVNIEGQAQGTHGLLIANTGAEPAAGAAPLRVVHTQGGDARFSVLSSNGRVDVGTFSYGLEQRDTDWYLVQGGTPVISSSTQTAIALFSAAPTVWYGELSTLRSRMGELRSGYGQGGFWARSYGNKYRVAAADQVHYAQNQQGVSFGVDTPLPSQGGLWLLGVMAGYSDSQLDMRLGSNGRVASYYLGVYSTWLADNGYYVDAVLKANRFQNSSDVRMSDGRKAKGEYSNHGIGASVEVGKHFKLDDGWFVEPYAQGSALWVDGASYSLDNGMRASTRNADSLLAKAGSHVGRTFALADGGFVQPYVKAAYAHEFARDNQVRVNDTRFANDLSGSRIELGAGVNAQLTDVLQVQAGFDYMKGERIEQPWGVNLGVRYNW
ncbi:autotransporter outer membrane beta-barrel domain-containing protein [Pseudomonas sp. GZD-209]|uniref:autotransporter outer membrane beta-barrel domain-containing protein n=1 Tax=Pseudomonas sp. GZD-209 TaxID=3404807 RepID=UPI003BB6A165